jgi:lysozyme
MRPIPIEILFKFLKAEEGLVLRAYDDQRPKKILQPGDKLSGILTAGIGHTGSDVVIGMKVTAGQSKIWLERDLQQARERLYASIGSVVEELTEYQYAALLSFVFNLGTKKTWTIWKVVKARHFEQVPQELMKFVNAKIDGELQKMQGLVKRRAAEVVLWSTAEPGVSALPVSSAVTRTVETPPTPGEAKPTATTAPVITTAIATVAAVPVAAAQINAAVAPWAEHSALVGQIVAGVATIAAVAAILGLVFSWIKARRIRR